jgi:glycosyltransferase involved in cell wall biosynthesis
MLGLVPQVLRTHIWMSSKTGLSVQIDQKPRLVFVGGLHRSGTTMLSKMLACHPGISALSRTDVTEDEGQFLQTVYPVDALGGGPGRFAFSEASYQIDWRSTGSSAFAAAKMMAAWAPYWDMNRDVLLEKTPGNLIRSPYLQEIFPGASFIFITRHPVSVSLATQKWSDTSLFSLVTHWVDAYRAAKSDSKQLERCLWLSYEQLVCDPQSVLDAVCSFLELPPVKAKINPSRRFDFAYHSIWKKLSSRHSINFGSVEFTGRQNTLQRQLSRLKRVGKLGFDLILMRLGVSLYTLKKEVRDISLKFEGALNEFGYSFGELDRYPVVQQIVGKRDPAEESPPDPKSKSARRQLIFEPGIAGHRAHYINILAREAMRRRDGFTVTFAIRREIIPKLEKDVAFFLRETTGDVQVYYLNPADIQRIAVGPAIFRGYEQWKLALRVCDELGIDDLTVLLLDDLLPGLLAWSPTKLAISGIYFRPTIQYPEYRRSVLGKIRQFFKYVLINRVLARSDIAAILSFDPYFCRYASESLANGRKIQLLAEPFNARHLPSIKVRERETARFLLFGAMQKRKGIPEFLAALHLISPDELAKAIFIVCGEGELSSTIEKAIPELIAIGAKIEYYRGYISQTDLNQQIDMSDVILAPYRGHVGSSGVIYMAAGAGKPVLAPTDGLVGRQVTDYNLGIAVDTSSPQKIAEAICKFIEEINAKPRIERRFSAFTSIDGEQRFCSRVLECR